MWLTLSTSIDLSWRLMTWLFLLQSALQRQIYLVWNVVHVYSAQNKNIVALVKSILIGSYTVSWLCRGMVAWHAIKGIVSMLEGVFVLTICDGHAKMSILEKQQHTV